MINDSRTLNTSIMKLLIHTCINFGYTFKIDAAKKRIKYDEFMAKDGKKNMDGVFKLNTYPISYYNLLFVK